MWVMLEGLGLASVLVSQLTLRWRHGRCCKTIFFPPGHGKRLPMDLELDGPYVLRLRNFVGGRNTFTFNGADRSCPEPRRADV